MNTIHERTIAALQRDYPQAKTRGFRRAVHKLQWDWEGWETAESKPTWKDFMECGEIYSGRIIPDLWWIDEECMSVICIEVEDTSLINSQKLATYEHLWWCLDGFHWELHLLCSDRWGNLIPVPMFDMIFPHPISHYALSKVVAEEGNAKAALLGLSKAYCLRDGRAREKARADWLDKNPGFSRVEFLKERAMRESSL